MRLAGWMTDLCDTSALDPIEVPRRPWRILGIQAYTPVEGAGGVCPRLVCTECQSGDDPCRRSLSNRTFPLDCTLTFLPALIAPCCGRLEPLSVVVSRPRQV